MQHKDELGGVNSEPKPKQFVIERYCRACWQEGIFRFPGDVPPEGWPDPGKMPGVAQQHAWILKGFIKAGKCVGDIHPQQLRSVTKRVRKMRPPPLPDVGEPIIIAKRGTP